MKDHDELWTSNEAARYLWGDKGSYGMLAKWRYKNSGPKYMKLGQLIRYCKQDLDDFIAEQKLRNEQGCDTMTPVPKPPRLPMPIELREERLRIRREKARTQHLATLEQISKARAMKPKTKSDNTLLTPTEAAYYLWGEKGVTSTLDAWRRPAAGDRGPKYIMVENKARYYKRDLDDFKELYRSRINNRKLPPLA